MSRPAFCLSAQATQGPAEAGRFAGAPQARSLTGLSRQAPIRQDNQGHDSSRGGGMFRTLIRHRAKKLGAHSERRLFEKAVRMASHLRAVQSADRIAGSGKDRAPE